jgi:glycosyltransferase involved in cell wall biosynthesis
VRTRILHVITALGGGGTERALVRLIAQSDPKRFRHLVVSLRDEGTQGEAHIHHQLAAEGAELVRLKIAGGAGLPRAAVRLARIARRWRPALVQGWMYHGNLAATLAGVAARVPFVWAIRQSLHDLRDEPRATALAIRISALLSTYAAAVLYNSRRARAHHEALGFAGRRGLVIPNGFPASLFEPLDLEQRRALRYGLGLADRDLVFGVVARNHRVKGYDLLLAAAAIVAERSPNLRLVVCGLGTEALIEGLPERLRGRTLTLGERPDAAQLMHAFDVYVLSSRAEAFPNCVAEAMAASVPVIASDVGDAADIVGETGWLVPRGDAAALAEAMLAAALSTDLAARGAAARARVLDRYSLDRMASAYQALYERLIQGDARCAVS